MEKDEKLKYANIDAIKAEYYSGNPDVWLTVDGNTGNVEIQDSLKKRT